MPTRKLYAGAKLRDLRGRLGITQKETEKTADGRSICLENFLIDVAKKMQLGGFGDNAIQDAQGNWHALHSRSEEHTSELQSR